MPELPEVETTRRGVAPFLENRPIRAVRIHEPRLRWPIPDDLATRLTGATPLEVDRRAKYLLVRFETGTLMIHLGMSGSLRIVTDGSPRQAHDHVELELGDGQILRYNDPRRFGAWLWSEAPESHPLISHLGPEPLDPLAFTGHELYRLSRGKTTSIKAFIMDSRVVVGVGNIYANEALFMAGIHPKRHAGKVGRARMVRLVESIREILTAAILMGGTTLRDFVNSDGKPGYFAQSLNVYGRGGEPCRNCGMPLKEIRLGQRSTVYCSRCQK
ncbi:bifunctional DNA-formamidopyrimidine glycosylase/DNA-(apurinic or apyrimidinic site) lyase [Marinobacter nanhaiticus D15-8W]|uniref:Formamidopyrimidine-DNA glycosylase n=1 Tax=Marinobacter nanhaiticus D15-8W TaxID=626887 RepID=N6X2Z6_9GAMM|nr:bifunctional DNA-formamidopyrimidine glycosylase/DNA-(apurinic or apyrimidinic site) lyase [Marinobacter nanhaiticus]ENO15458.1 bifunctional DNA-formamidopyrimidine glycosylase/DNA-(apurinic or apyrimidinic site) lyase [Marinobacter nanhaiticus D15-8W]BES73692.1 bifunctional DNA-formamidopyrimidine glycosylase/DNA-(apurinic or apyrimidinic site) lyase [Marinobacter nanhaiticus D15-8W]